MCFCNDAAGRSHGPNRTAMGECFTYLVCLVSFVFSVVNYCYI